MVDIIQREAFDWLDAPVLRATNLDVPMPYAAHLENQVIVGADRVRAAIEKVLYVR
jgi:pyruvate dehydrogenase E1 component beta subunit